MLKITLGWANERAIEIATIGLGGAHSPTVPRKVQRYLAKFLNRRVRTAKCAFFFGSALSCGFAADSSEALRGSLAMKD